MRVIRTMPDEGWVPISNEAARDHRLSWRARGLLAELLSYPDGWRTSIDDLVKLGQIADGHAEGRDAMRTAMNELVQAGYVVRTKTKEKNGRFASSFTVADDPKVHRGTENPASVNQGLPNQRSGDQAQEFQSVINKTVTNTVTKTDLQGRSTEHSASLTSFADGADAPPTIDTETSTLDDVYRMVNMMDAGVRRNGLLDLERRRPKIYREARRSAIAQIKKDHPSDFNHPRRAESIDRLSYQYAVLHYYPDLPPWMTRPISQGLAASSSS